MSGVSRLLRRRETRKPRYATLCTWSLVLATVCGATGGSGAEERSSQPVPRLRVITYNCQFLPEPASIKNERPQPFYRARRIAEEVKQFDVVALQEIFHHEHRAALLEHLRAAWRNQLKQVFSPTPEDFYTSGGCLLLTRQNIVASASVVFEERSRPEQYGLRADGFAAKGVIHGRVAVGHEMFVDVYVTHMEARADALRPKQYGELAKFVHRTSDPQRPLLILGDLNTRGAAEFRHDPTSQYGQLMRALVAVRPQGVVDVWAALRGDELGGTTDQQSVDVGKRIDYVLLGNPAPPTPRLSPASIEVRTYQDEIVGALSDHNAVVAEFLCERP